MASLSRDGKAGWRVLFVCPTSGKRKTLRTGRCAEKDAQTLKNMVERIIEAKQLGQPLSPLVLNWLDGIGDTLRDRLARVGLIDPPETTELAPFLHAYIGQRQQRGDVAEGTVVFWGHTQRNLVEFFGAAKTVQSVTSEHADNWAAWLKSDQGLAENTIRKRSQQARAFFDVALRRKLIQENPFAGLVGTVVPVPERQVFIPRSTVEALLPQCAGPEYRLLLILARYMGVRVPSEVVPLKWVNVDWQTMTLTITSPKTRRHKGGGKRVCPIFPELMPFLQEAWEAAPEGAIWIFPSIRTGQKNLRTWLERAILRAGLKPWPRLWQNFRASRATELADKFPSHVAAAWLGHTEKIADGHYRQVIPEHLQRAVTEATGEVPKWSDSGPRKPAQNPAQYPQRIVGKGGEPVSGFPEKTQSYTSTHAGAKAPSEGEGTRTPPDSPGETALFEDTGTESGTLDSENPLDDPRLGEVVEAWATLSEALKNRILGMVREASRSGE